MTERLLRADLHVHSYHSGYASHLRFLRTRDCYSLPEDVYRTAKRRGMDVVTITDHDSIGGCLEFLDRHPDADDFIVSEEVECLFPGLPLKAHVAAYGIDERIHREIQPLRGNVYDVVAYLAERDVFFALNHLFFFLDRQMPVDEYLAAMLPRFRAFEVRNGAMLQAHNELIAGLAGGAAAGRTVTGIGGSDAHTLRFIGTTYTEAPGRNAAGFLQSLRAGRARVGGRHGGVGRVAAEIYGVIGRYWAALLGFGRHDLSVPRRALGLAFSLVSLPFEFTPLLIAAIDKSGEARRVAAFAEHLAEQRAGAFEPVSAVEPS